MGDVDKLIGEVDMGLELGGLKKPENFSRAAVEVGQMENGF
jgi:hypothetical protein